MNRWTEDDIKTAINMIISGKTYNEISECLKRTPKAVSNMLISRGHGFIKEKNLNDRIIYTRRINKSGKECLFCKNKLITGRNHKIFCNTSCSAQYRQKLIFKKIEEGNLDFHTKTFKNYLVYKYGNKCIKCGWCEVNPKTGLVPIQMDHIDGNPDNNSLDNIRLLCPNCHSLTPTYGSSNKNGSNSKRNKAKLKYYYENKKICKCGTTIKGKSDVCNKCSKINNRKVIRPKLETLIDEIKESSYLNVGKKYGVSDNAIRKWVKSYGLNPKDIKNNLKTDSVQSKVVSLKTGSE